MSRALRTIADVAARRRPEPRAKALSLRAVVMGAPVDPERLTSLLAVVADLNETFFDGRLSPVLVVVDEPTCGARRVGGRVLLTLGRVYFASGNIGAARSVLLRKLAALVVGEVRAS